MEQDYFSRSKYVNDKFNVSYGTRVRSNHVSIHSSVSPDTLIISGVDVGVVTEISHFDLDIDSAWSDNLFSMIRLFHYRKVDSNDVFPGTLRASLEAMTLLNASWGPPKIEVGDIIIVSNASSVRLVLRQTANSSFHFIGGCCLVDSILQGVEDEFADLATDPGFSPIMHGGAWDDQRIQQFSII